MKSAMSYGAWCVLCCLIGLLIAVSPAPCSADMVIKLRDGSVKRLPYSRQDVIDIVFEESAFEGISSGSVGAVSFTMDFETGNLQGWRQTGEAFKHQPTYGDNPTARRRGQPSRHQGNYWIGGFENRPGPDAPAGRTQGDEPQGTLTSSPFTINHSTISFLIGGGCDINAVRAELLLDGQVAMKATGKCTETMERVRWNVSQFSGRSAQIRLVDNSSGGWGHINFDDLKFE